jgi:hypothetical protein
MFGPSTLTQPQPHDVCLKCGRPTPIGVSLCENDNPGRIKSPSTTQVHGTIVIGVIAGFLLVLGLLRVGTSAAGTFQSAIVGTASRPDGALEVAVRVTNSGTRAVGASCRISANGAPDFRDYAFFTDPIPAGGSTQFSKTVTSAPGGGAIELSSLVVRCT